MPSQIINIIGFGIIGQASGIGLKRLGYEVHAYDIVKKKNIHNQKEFNEIPLHVGNGLPKSGIHIVCIADQNLPDEKQEVEHIAPVLKQLYDNGTVILRTTVLPRLLRTLTFDFYWVEFLHERTAIEEFLNPEIVVVGRKHKQPFPFKKHFNPIYYCTPEEASHIKYLNNIWNALRIAFVNEFGDNLLKKKCAPERIIDFLFKKQKYLRWGNAFGGHCIPKDTRAYAKEYSELLFLKTVLKANKIHCKKFPNLPPIY